MLEVTGALFMLTNLKRLFYKMLLIRLYTCICVTGMALVTTEVWHTSSQDLQLAIDIVNIVLIAASLHLHRSRLALSVSHSSNLLLRHLGSEELEAKFQRHVRLPVGKITTEAIQVGDGYESGSHSPCLLDPTLAQHSSKNQLN